MASCWGSAGYLGDKAFRRQRRHYRTLTARDAARERELVARLSDADIRKIMVRVLVGSRTAKGCIEARLEVDRADFRRAGIPDSRIDENFDAALATARRRDSRIDAMGGLQ